MSATTHSIKVVGVTYAFWLGVALLNFELLGGLALPIVFPLYAKFLPFLVIPLALSAAATFASLKVLKLRSALLANVAFLALFLLTGDIYRQALMWQELLGHHPECVDYGSFTRSLFSKQRNFVGNGMYEEHGQVFLWSYRERSFFKASPGLAANFTCKENA